MELIQSRTSFGGFFFQIFHLSQEFHPQALNSSGLSFIILGQSISSCKAVLANPGTNIIGAQGPSIKLYKFYERFKLGYFCRQTFLSSFRRFSSV